MKWFDENGTDVDAYPEDSFRGGVYDRSRTIEQHTREGAYQRAEKRAAASGLDANAAAGVAERVMEIWHPEFTRREFDQFIDQEIARHAQE